MSTSVPVPALPETVGDAEDEGSDEVIDNVGVLGGGQSLQISPKKRKAKAAPVVAKRKAGKSIAGSAAVSVVSMAPSESASTALSPGSDSKLISNVAMYKEEMRLQSLMNGTAKLGDRLHQARRTETALQKRDFEGSKALLADLQAHLRLAEFCADVPKLALLKPDRRHSVVNAVKIGGLDFPPAAIEQLIKIAARENPGRHSADRDKLESYWGLLSPFVEKEGVEFDAAAPTLFNSGLEPVAVTKLLSSVLVDDHVLSLIDQQEKGAETLEVLARFFLEKLREGHAITPAPPKMSA
eukprot:6468198-Amphidinium_carterae.3